MGIYFVLSVCVAVACRVVAAFVACFSGRRLGWSRKRSSTPSACSRKISDALEVVLQRLIDAVHVSRPVLWNWIASSTARVRSTCSRSARSRHARFGSPREQPPASRKPLAKSCRGPYRSRVIERSSRGLREKEHPGGFAGVFQKRDELTGSGALAGSARLRACLRRRACQERPSEKRQASSASFSILSMARSRP